MEIANTYLIRYRGEVKGELEWGGASSPQEAEGKPRWLFVPPHGDDEEWDDLGEGQADEALDRAKREIARDVASSGG